MERRSADNAWHPLPHPAYVEWWYLDAVFETGDVLSGSLGLWGDLSRPAGMTARSDFFLRRGTGEILDFSTWLSFDHFAASTTECNVRLGPHCLSAADGLYTLSLRGKRAGCQLDLHFAPCCPGFDHCYRPDESDHAFWWVVPAPAADVSGVLRLPGETFPLVGHGYHDHNWASLSITREFAGWDWGRLHHDAYTVVFARVLGPTSSLFEVIYWANRQTGGTRLLTDAGGLLQTQRNGNSWTVRGGKDGFALALELDGAECLLEHTVDRRYTRLLSRGRGVVGGAGDGVVLTGPVLHETQRFQPSGGGATGGSV